MAQECGNPTLAHPLGPAVVAQAARHIIEGERWHEVEPVLVAAIRGGYGRLRGDVADVALRCRGCGRHCRIRARARPRGADRTRRPRGCPRRTCCCGRSSPRRLSGCWRDADRSWARPRKGWASRDRPQPGRNPGRCRRSLRRGRGQRRGRWSPGHGAPGVAGGTTVGRGAAMPGAGGHGRRTGAGREPDRRHVLLGAVPGCAAVRQGRRHDRAWGRRCASSRR